MRARGKSKLLIILASMALITMALSGTGCSGSGDGTSNGEADLGNEVSDSIPPGSIRSMGAMGNLDEVAAILGIEEEELEAAFNQAMSEMFEGDGMPSGEGMPGWQPPEGEMPDGGPPEGSFPEGIPPEGGMRGGGHGMMSDELLARVAEILGIDQQTLEGAFAEVQEQDT